MKIIDEKLLAEFRARRKCEFCGHKVATDPAHIFARGMGGGKRLDIRINLVALCRFCHDMNHKGLKPNEKDLLAIAAKREGTTPEAIRDEVNRLRQSHEKRIPRRSRKGKAAASTRKAVVADQRESLPTHPNGTDFSIEATEWVDL